jgi:NAD(P)-dependent dehydrogenase (short-subunit alcohol dehydrogenase family)
LSANSKTAYHKNINKYAGDRYGTIWHSTSNPGPVPVNRMREAGQNHDHRLALVTGATGAIGKAIAVKIALQPGYRVVLLCRDTSRAGKAVSEVAKLSGNEWVSHEIVDLSSKDSIQALAQRLQDPVQVLVNNAAATPLRRRETPVGIELQFATNVLGYFWSTRAFKDQLRAGSPSRVVNVASYWAGDLDLDDLEFRRRPYDNNTAYRQSKQANRMLTVAFAERFRKHGIAVNACHPGDVKSRLSNDLGFGGHETSQQGARTPAWLATDAIGQRETGKYFEHMRMRHCRFGEDSEAVDALYEACMAY